MILFLGTSANILPDPICDYSLDKYTNISHNIFCIFVKTIITKIIPENHPGLLCLMVI